MLTRNNTIWAGILLGCGLLAYYLVSLDWASFFAALKNLTFVPLMAYALLILAGTGCRSVRCACLLQGGSDVPDIFSKAARLWGCWKALCAAYLGNIIYPAKAGEIIRMTYLHSFFRIPGSRTLTLVFIDRLCDLVGVGIVGILLLALFLPKQTAALHESLMQLGIISLLLVGLCLLAYCFRRTFENKMNHYTKKISSEWFKKILAFLLQSLEAFQAIQSPWTVTVALLWTLGALCMDGAACWVLLLAFDWHLPVAAPVLMQLALAVAGSLPSTPGYVGIYQAAAVLVLAQFGLSEAAGVAYATVLQAMNLGIFLVCGWLPFRDGICRKSDRRNSA